MRSMARHARSLLLGLSAALPLACGDDPARTDGGVLGTYALESIDGQALPAVISEDDLLREEVMGGQLDLSTGGICLLRFQFRQIDPDGESNEGEEELPCEWGVSGSLLVLDFGDDVERGTVTGSTVTLDLRDRVWVFRR